MLSLEASDLYAEIDAAEKERDKHLTRSEAQIKQYHGPAWQKNDQDYPENHAYESNSLMLPKVAYENPEVSVTSRLYHKDAETAAAIIEQAISSWIRRIRLRALSARWAQDSMFDFGAGMVTRGREGGFPALHRIPKRWFGMDHLATHWDAEPRFYFRKWVIDKADLVKLAKSAAPEEGWDLKAIEDLSEDAGVEDLGETWRGAPKRKQCVLYDMYLAKHQLEGKPGPDEGFNGTLVRLAIQRSGSGTKAGIVGAPRPWWGCSTGPFQVFGIYSVPDSCWPLGPLTATQGQNDALNARARAIQRANCAYKKIVLVDAMNPKVAEAFKDKPDLFVLPVEGFKKDQVEQYEIGGAAQIQLEDFALLRARLDRDSGITDAQRGNVTGDGTAREVMIAADSASARMDYVALQHTDAITGLMEKVGYWFLMDPRVVVPLDREASELLKEQTGEDIRVYKGGTFGPGVKFEDLEFTIQPYSMQRVNELVGQQRAMQKMQFLMAAAPVMAATPWVNWDKALQGYGNSMNDPTYSEILDMEELKKGQEAFAQAQKAQNAGV